MVVDSSAGRRRIASSAHRRNLPRRSNENATYRVSDPQVRREKDVVSVRVLRGNDGFPPPSSFGLGPTTLMDFKLIQPTHYFKIRTWSISLA